MQTKTTQSIDSPGDLALENQGRMPSKIAFLTRIYIWSIVLEPMLFFKAEDTQLIGVTLDLSRILQLIVLMGLIFNLVSFSLTPKRANIRLPKMSNFLYVNYGMYLIIGVIAGIIGLLSGAYHMPNGHMNFDNGATIISKFIGSSDFRPIFEYIIAIYYFLYFSILPRYFIKTDECVRYFFYLFNLVFVVSMILGFLDLLYWVFTDNTFIPKHIDGWTLVGPRFHGLAGEPREAFVYLFFGLAVLYLQSYYKGSKLNILWPLIIIMAALLTQSASGLIGIAAFLGLYFIYSINKLGKKRMVQLIVVFLLTTPMLYMAVTHSERIMYYWNSAAGLWGMLESGNKLPYVLYVQSQNIYPLYDLIVKARSLNIAPILIGSGFGSASVINDVYQHVMDVANNPNAQFVRLLFESGVVGTFFFIMAFIYPVARLTKRISYKRRNIFMMLTILLVGCFMGERSSTPYIYLGVFIAVFHVLGCDAEKISQKQNAMEAISFPAVDSAGDT